MKRKKDGKQKREQKRIQHANTYKEGFDHGFKLGLLVAEQQRKDEANGNADRNSGMFTLS